MALCSRMFHCKFRGGKLLLRTVRPERFGSTIKSLAPNPLKKKHKCINNSLWNKYFSQQKTLRWYTNRRTPGGWHRMRATNTFPGFLGSRTTPRRLSLRVLACSPIIARNKHSCSTDSPSLAWLLFNLKHTVNGLSAPVPNHTYVRNS